MAAKPLKKLKEEIKEEVIVIEEVKKEEIKEEVVIEPVQEIAKPSKMVKVKMKDRHKCCIGGEWYYLEEDKQYFVSENVKEILMKADKLLPL